MKAGCLAFLAVVALAKALPSDTSISGPDPSQDANHIFNALHSSMRQFGSSLRHNGMSAFLAWVPAHTEFFHGGPFAEPVRGFEWLAFEPEHAGMFARSFFRPPAEGEQWTPSHRSPLLDMMGEDGHPQPRPRPVPGWLHTYRTKHPLKLLYLDGMSAGKTTNGTLDFGDLAVIKDNDMGWNDWKRGRKLCDFADGKWNGKIDGILRMEAGFEIILCDFEKHLDTISVNRVSNTSVDFSDTNRADIFFEYWRAVSDRFHGIGGDRVRVYYDEFVTAYGRGLDLSPESSNGQPRLLNVSEQELSVLGSEVDDLVNRSPDIFARVDSWQNWQTILDLIVARYASRLTYLQSSKFRGQPDALHREVERTLAPFIDHDNRSIMEESRRCAAHFIPEVSHPSQAAEAVVRISQDICSSLFVVLEYSEPDAATSLLDPFNVIDRLVAYLDWTTWKKCKACAVDELCVVPVWPFGSFADHEEPSCHNASAAFEQRGYWGF